MYSIKGLFWSDQTESMHSYALDYTVLYLRITQVNLWMCAFVFWFHKPFSENVFRILFPIDQAEFLYRETAVQKAVSQSHHSYNLRERRERGMVSRKARSKETRTRSLCVCGRFLSSVSLIWVFNVQFEFGKSILSWLWSLLIKIMVKQSSFQISNLNTLLNTRVTAVIFH